MQEKLIILLHANDLTRPSWALVDGSMHVSKSIYHGDTESLAEAAKDREVVVVVPAEDVLLASIEMPKMSRSRLQQAIPYALEEQVIEDVDTMHFAVGDYLDGQVATAVVAKNKMVEWMALLQSFNVTADVMLPRVFSLPVTDNIWHVEISDVATVRTGELSGFACDKRNLNELLGMALTATQPAEIQVDTCESDDLQLDLPVTVNHHQMSKAQLVDGVAKQAAGEPPINLLQGDFQNKKSKRMPKMKNAIRVASYLFAAWLVILFIYPVVSYVILNQRVSGVHEQIVAIYKRQFPNSKSVVAPKQRMQRKLNKLTSGVGDNQFLLTIANIGKGLSQSSGVQLKRLDFQNNMTTLEISAASSSEFATFTDALSRQGLRVKQQNADLNGARVSATLRIE